MEPIVELRGVVATAGGFPVLAGIDLEVEPGRVVVLAGPNGAGKTSLLRVCAGLLPVVAGSGRVLGFDLCAEPEPIRTHVGFAGHRPGLYSDLTVAENLRFWCRRRGADAAGVERACEAVGLAPRLSHVPAGRLSEGQRRRVALALLVARRPTLWLLDEPHAGLDRDGRDRVDGLIVGAAAAGATVVLSSHELARSRSLADMVVTLAGGVVVTCEEGGRSPGPSSPAELRGVSRVG